MSTEITPDGHVLPPLNITKPAPFIHLRGFHWDAVDGIEASKPSHDEDGQPSAEHQVFQRRADTSPPTLPAPRLPANATEQFLGVPGRTPPKPMEFPLEQFRGVYAGNGFNMIFRPRSSVASEAFNPNDGPDDNILEVNLTTEQLTFGAPLGNIPNRGLGKQGDITLTGVPYMQTIQDVTNEATGKGDKAVPTDIHFEPGVWLKVPAANFHSKGDSVVRMASIPHGTTINAQGIIPQRVKSTHLGGEAKEPVFDVLDTTPFDIGDPSSRRTKTFKSMDATKENSLRTPKRLDHFKPLITTSIIKNPNEFLKNTITGQKITETLTFEVCTGPSPKSLRPTAELNGGGTANISFLAGKQEPLTTAAPTKTDNPNAHCDFMHTKYWVESVAYQVVVRDLKAGETALLRPTMPTGCTAPTPLFAITAPPGGVTGQKTVTVPGFQIQYSQTVNLNFGPDPSNMLTWPHVSVGTLVPTDAQPFQMQA